MTLFQISTLPAGKKPKKKKKKKKRKEKRVAS
jgi:hypothetical protein